MNKPTNWKDVVEAVKKAEKVKNPTFICSVTAE